MSIDRAELLFAGLIESDRGELGDDPGEQTRVALGRLADTLAGRGLGLGDLLRLRLFVADLGEMGLIEGELQSHLGLERPAVSIVELSAGSLPPGASVSLDAVAAPSARGRRRLTPGAARLGPWVFLDALAAVEPRGLFTRMDELLRAQGAELRDVVRLGSWLTFPMRDYGPLAAVRRELVASAGLLPASAGVQVGRVGAAGERLACEAIAYAPGGRGARESSICAEQSLIYAEPPAHATSRLADFYLDARAAGGYVFTSGEVPDGRGSPAEQAHEVYERLRAHLAAHGAEPRDVAQQTVFVRATRSGDANADDAAAGRTAVAEAAHAFYGATLPPTTLLAVADLGFQPGCAVEIELVAQAR